eukprot:Skav213581  [mRNA]  locus=scaffold1790:251421:253976:- [translate_table: standard]
MEKVKDLPPVKDMLEKSKPILGYDLLDICLNGPEEKLEETREYTALCAAGVMSFEDGLKLVKLRGEAMQEAAMSSKQLMLSVAGIEKVKVDALCKEAAAKEAAARRVTWSQAINTLKDLAEKNGALQARRVAGDLQLQFFVVPVAKILKTAGAFHTSLMQPAQDWSVASHGTTVLPAATLGHIMAPRPPWHVQDKLSAALEETLPNMKPPLHTVWMNASAQPIRPGTDPKEIVALLKRHAPCFLSPCDGWIVHRAFASIRVIMEIFFQEMARQFHWKTRHHGCKAPHFPTSMLQLHELLKWPRWQLAHVAGQECPW